jgi:hypothetical protein
MFQTRRLGPNKCDIGGERNSYSQSMHLKGFVSCVEKISSKLQKFYAGGINDFVHESGEVVPEKFRTLLLSPPEIQETNLQS